MTKTFCTFALALTTLAAAPSAAQACGGYGDFVTPEMRAEQAVWMALDRAQPKARAVEVDVTLANAERGVAVIRFEKGAKTKALVVKVKDRWTVRPLRRA